MSSLQCILMLCLAALTSATFAVDEQTGTLYDVVATGLVYWRLSFDVAQWPGALGTAPFPLDANNLGCALCDFDCTALSAPPRLQCGERATGRQAMLLRDPQQPFLSLREANMSRTVLHTLVVCLYSEFTARNLAIPRQ